MIYLTPDEVEACDHDEIVENTLRLKRIVCEKCNILMSPAKSAGQVRQLRGGGVTGTIARD